MPDNLQQACKGVAFPLSVNPATGKFEMISGALAVRQSVCMILKTAKSERFVRPDYGSGIMGYTFMDVSATMLNLLSKELAGDIVRNEPRVDNVEVSFSRTDKEGCLLVNVSYTMKENNMIDNVVFPFDINREI